jgi:hypothetical protein
MLIPSLRLSREDGMGKPYSMDLRERVVAAIESGLTWEHKFPRRHACSVQRVNPGVNSNITKIVVIFQYHMAEKGRFEALL